MKYSLKIIVLLAVAISATGISCNTSKETTQNATSTAAPPPCFQKGISDNLFFRASSSASSSNIKLARDKAIAAAKTELGKKIMSHTITAAEKYAALNEIADKNSFRKAIETIANKAIDKTLAPTTPTCESYSEANSRYTAYISVEISQQTIFNNINEMIYSEMQNFDKQKFEKIFFEQCE